MVAWGQSGSGYPLASYEYDDAGRLTTRSLANGLATTYAFDAVDNVTSIVVTKSGSTPVVLWSNSYGYDDLNRRTYTKWADGKHRWQGCRGVDSLKSCPEGETSGSERVNIGDTYDYDATSQVIGVKYSGTNPEAGFGSIGGVATTATWDFDIAGNRETQVINSATTTYAVNDINQYMMVDSGSLNYNTRGDLLTHGDWTLAYNAFGHLISATGTSAEVHKYYYDAGGTRVGKQLHGEDPVFFFHVGFDRLEDVDTSNGDVTSYVYEPGIDRPLAMISDSGYMFFFHQDVLGNVVALTNEAGTIAQQYRYSVWGEPSVFDATNQQLPPNNAASPFLFTAREYDVETGLYHYRARAYSPDLGRFLQFDPIDFGGRDIDILVYAQNAPILFGDPMGLAYSERVSNRRIQRAFLRSVNWDVSGGDRGSGAGTIYGGSATWDLHIVVLCVSDCDPSDRYVESIDGEVTVDLVDGIGTIPIAYGDPSAAPVGLPLMSSPANGAARLSSGMMRTMYRGIGTLEPGAYEVLARAVTNSRPTSAAGVQLSQTPCQ